MTVDFAVLSLKGKDGITAIKLMMACNDLTLANHAQGQWEHPQPSALRYRAQGARQYFVRLQIGHLQEGLAVVKEVEKSPTLSSICLTLEPDLQQTYAELLEYAEGGRRRAEFQDLARIRSDLTFHYNKTGKVIQKAMLSRAARPHSRISLMTRSDHVHYWHFKAADDVIETAIVRDIWNIPINTDTQAEADVRSDHIFRLAIRFADFASVLVWKFLKH